MTRLTPPIFALAPLLLAACGHEHAYVTAGPGAAGAAARYSFPIVQPRGDIFTTSFGFVEAELEAQQRARLLHARIVVVNHGPDTWTIDAREQLVELGGTKPILPAIVNTDSGGGPLYTLSPGQARTFDLYFALGSSVSDGKGLGEFDLLWRVHVGAESIGQCTSFKRFDGSSGPQEPTPDPVFAHLGQAPNWWYGAGAASRHPPAIRNYYYPPLRARTAPPPPAARPPLTRS